MRVLSTIPYTAIRMLRNYIYLILLLVVPILLITMFYLILSGVNVAGVQPFHEVALIQILVFQIFGGSIVMSFMQQDFFTEMKLRIRILPFNATMYAFSIVMCGTIFSILLGVLLMAFTQIVLGVIWQHWLWIILIVVLMAVLSSIVYMIITLCVKKFSLAELLSVVYGVSLVVLAGLFFPMPESPFFTFMGSYGNPLTLSMMAIQVMDQGNIATAWTYAGILFALNVVLFILMLILGRRKMV